MFEFTGRLPASLQGRGWAAMEQLMISLSSAKTRMGKFWGTTINSLTLLPNHALLTQQDRPVRTILINLLFYVFPHSVVNSFVCWLPSSHLMFPLVSIPCFHDCNDLSSHRLHEEDENMVRVTTQYLSKKGSLNAAKHGRDAKEHARKLTHLYLNDQYIDSIVGGIVVFLLFWHYIKIYF